MRIAQLAYPDGRLHAAVVENDQVIDVGGPDSRQTLDFLTEASRRGVPLATLLDDARATTGRPAGSLADLSREQSSADGPRLAIPICPPEVWGCGVTYRRSAEFRDEDTAQTTKGIYDYVYSAPRPEIFFKATAARCVGPNEPIAIRSDSSFTAPEPELAFVLDARGQIVGFTIADDVSAWDIERENPLYLPQSKIFRGCCALGPVIVTPDEIGDPNKLDLTCRILRHGEVLFEGEVNTSRIGRTFAELIEYLTRDNPIPDGTVVCSGTGVIVEREHALRSGDVVEITIERIGSLRNPVEQLG